MKYKYIGTTPALVIEYNVEVNPGDTVELDGIVDSPLLVLVQDPPIQPKKGVSE